MAQMPHAASARYHSSARQFDEAGRTVLAIAGAMFSLIGLVLATGGFLSTLNGSEFYMMVGFGLIVSGALIAKRHRAGLWTYMIVFAATLAWSLRHVEIGGSSLALRLMGPSVLLAMIAVLVPLLRGWRPRQAMAVFAVLIAAMIALGTLSSSSGPLARPAGALSHFLDAEMKGLLK